MKRHSSFDNIPTLPRTFSGQWMTFSHMANHYRKLINVKPRVDTGIPHNVYDFPKAPSRKGTAGKSRPSTTEGVKLKHKGSSRPRLASKMIDYEYHALSKGLINSPNGSYKAESSSDGYQIVFGPSSIKSSVDAMISDPDPDIEVIAPKLSSISISEKIRKFLDHVHAQDSQPKLLPNGGRPLSCRGERKQPLSKSNINHNRDHLLLQDTQQNHSNNNLNHNNHVNRHSKCFTPFEVPAQGTKKRVVKPSSGINQRLISHPTRHQQAVTLLSAHSKSVSVAKVSSDGTSGTMNHSGNNKKSAKRPLQSHSTTLSNFHHPSQFLSEMDHTVIDNHRHYPDSPGIHKKPGSGSLGGHSKKGSRKETKKSPYSPALSPRSMSVGTIHGSDELTEEYMLESPRRGGSENVSSLRIDTEDLTADWLKERVERGVVRINNAYFSLAPGTSTSSLGIHHHPNKDSSRDSAYGFSSGESRITTRESTPEKKSKGAVKGSSDFHSSSGHHHHHHHHHHSSSNNNNPPKYKSSLSTVASSINQDISSHVESSGHSSCSEKSILRNKCQSSASRHEMLQEERYYRFLAKVTDDIVARGIYTNKGIKSIFKAHLMRNADLEMDKMLNMLERLRMDLGVPKDDSLNQLDFGYGSVEYSSGPYFYSRHNSENPSGSNSPANDQREDDEEITPLEGTNTPDSDNNNTTVV